MTTKKPKYPPEPEHPARVEDCESGDESEVTYLHPERCRKPLISEPKTKRPSPQRNKLI